MNITPRPGDEPENSTQNVVRRGARILSVQHSGVGIKEQRQGETFELFRNQLKEHFLIFVTLEITIGCCRGGLTGAMLRMAPVHCVPVRLCLVRR